MNVILKNILYLIFAILTNPVFWIAFLGPRILSMNLKFLRGKLGIKYNSEESPDELKELHDIINTNPWVYAWNDFNTQLFVTVMAFFFVFIGSFNSVATVCRKNGIEISLNYFSQSNFSLVLLIVLILIFIASLIFLLGDMLISEDILKKYLPDDNITGTNKYPPNTLLTWYRGILLLYGVGFSIWQAFELPTIISFIENANIQSTP